MRKLIKKILAPTGYTITRINVKPHPQRVRPVTAKHFFDMYFAHVSPSDFFFIQIGANDGKSEDLIHEYVIKYNLSGILLEPQAKTFEKLKETYAGHPNLTFANMGIAREEGTVPFYKLKDSLVTEKNHYQATAISSLNKETIKERLKKRIPKRLFPYISDNPEDYLQETTIETLTFDHFFNKYNLKKVDFIFIDCEGYDYEIIKLIDLDKYHPSIIYYESILLSDKDRAECESHLESNGYQIFRSGNDTCAYK